MVTQIETNSAVNEEHSPSIKAVNGLTKKVVGDVFDEWKTLSGHTFTAGFVVESLRTNDDVYKKLHGDRPVKDVTGSDVSKGKGFVSEVLRCIIYFADSTSESDIYTTILKIPGLESMEAVNNSGGANFPVHEEKFRQKMCTLHQTEVDFYEHLAKTIDIPVPRVFKTLPWKLGEAEGLIQMEDMTGKGLPLKIGACLTIPHIKEVVRHLAHMHRKVLTSEDKEFNSWKSKHNINQSAFVSMISVLNDSTSFLEICEDKEYFEPIFNKYQKFAMSREYVEYVFSESWKDLKMSPVIVHGDFHGGNMMWKLDENGEITNEIAAIFDWQVYHEGSPMSDLARILALCADGWTRRQAEEFIFDFYLDQLEKEMKEVGKRCPYTIDQVKKAYDYMYLTQCYMLVMIPKFVNEVFKDESPRTKQANIDASILRCKHAIQDMDRLLTGEMKDLYEKYGQ